jgi:tRNA nucleotidyltransferase (CCA-adding enzyme)
VTLEEDLRRRDLTINAMAKDPESGEIVDPFGGRGDLQAKVLRHVSDAFAEDPVRILRVARFAARFGFGVHPSTLRLMQQMVASGEADYLVPERVWQEFAKGLQEKDPARMLGVLRECGLQQKLLPGIDLARKDYEGSLPVRYALMVWPLDPAEVERLNRRLKVPNDVDDVASITARYRPFFSKTGASPEELLEFLKGADAFRRPERFAELLKAARLAAPGFDAERIEKARQAATAVDAGAIAKAAPPGEVAQRIDEARRAAIARAA